MVGTTPGSVNKSQATRKTMDEDVVGSSNGISEEATIGGVESTWGLDSTSRTQRKTLELVGRIGKKPLKVAIDSGSLDNYISAQECAARGLHIDTGRACERGTENGKWVSGSNCGIGQDFIEMWGLPWSGRSPGFPKVG